MAAPLPFVRSATMATRELHGVVVSSGLMSKSVKVRVGGQKWNRQLNKIFSAPKEYLVHDPNDSLRTGDVVAINPGWRTSRHKRHVVSRIIVPAQVPLDRRPPVPTFEERIAAYTDAYQAKKQRKAERKARDAEPAPRDPQPPVEEASP